MNERVSSIVNVLLDLPELHEDLESRLEALMERFKNLSEKSIRRMGQADPTIEKAGVYVTWICTMYKEGAWAADAPKTPAEAAPTPTSLPDQGAAPVEPSLGAPVQTPAEGTAASTEVNAVIGADATPLPAPKKRVKAPVVRMDIDIPDSDIKEMYELLSRFEAIKNKPIFISKNKEVNPKPGDITTYKSMSEVDEAIERAHDFIKKGTTLLSTVGDLSLYRITTFGAARQICVGSCDPYPKDAQYTQVTEHACTGDPGWPWAGWCTQMDNHYSSYTASPLYVVVNAKTLNPRRGTLEPNPYVQVYFGPGSAQANTAKNRSIDRATAEEIAPLFTAPEFAKYVKVGIDENKLKKIISQKTINRITKFVVGYQADEVDPETGRTIKVQKPPVFKYNEDCIDYLRRKGVRSTEKDGKKSVGLYEWHVNLIRNWNKPRNPSEAEIIATCKTEPMSSSDDNIGAVIAAIKPLHANEGVTMPEMLQTEASFEKEYSEILDKIALTLPKANNRPPGYVPPAD